jgi:hypothetical protein
MRELEGEATFLQTYPDPHVNQGKEEGTGVSRTKFAQDFPSAQTMIKRCQGLSLLLTVILATRLRLVTFAQGFRMAEVSAEKTSRGSMGM